MVDIKKLLVFFSFVILFSVLLSGFVFAVQCDTSIPDYSVFMSHNSNSKVVSNFYPVDVNLATNEYSYDYYSVKEESSSYNGNTFKYYLSMGSENGCTNAIGYKFKCPEKFESTDYVNSGYYVSGNKFVCKYESENPSSETASDADTVTCSSKVSVVLSPNGVNYVDPLKLGIDNSGVTKYHTYNIYVLKDGPAKLGSKLFNYYSVREGKNICVNKVDSTIICPNKFNGNSNYELANQYPLGDNFVCEYVLKKDSAEDNEVPFPEHADETSSGSDNGDTDSKDSDHKDSDQVDDSQPIVNGECDHAEIFFGAPENINYVVRNIPVRSESEPKIIYPSFAIVLEGANVGDEYYQANVNSGSNKICIERIERAFKKSDCPGAMKFDNKFIGLVSVTQVPGIGMVCKYDPNSEPQEHLDYEPSEDSKSGVSEEVSPGSVVEPEDSSDEDESSVPNVELQESGVDDSSEESSQVSPYLKSSKCFVPLDTSKFLFYPGQDGISTPKVVMKESVATDEDSRYINKYLAYTLLPGSYKYKSKKYKNAITLKVNGIYEYFCFDTLQEFSCPDYSDDVYLSSTGKTLFCKSSYQCVDAINPSEIYEVPGKEGFVSWADKEYELKKGSIYSGKKRYFRYIEDGDNRYCVDSVVKGCTRFAEGYIDSEGNINVDCASDCTCWDVGKPLGTIINEKTKNKVWFFMDYNDVTCLNEVPAPTCFSEVSFGDDVNGGCRIDFGFSMGDSEPDISSAVLMDYVDRALSTGATGLYLYTFSSPEGSSKSNLELAEQRHMATENLIAQVTMDVGITSNPFAGLTAVGETNVFSSNKFGSDRRAIITTEPISFSKDYLGNFLPAPDLKTPTVESCIPLDDFSEQGESPETLDENVMCVSDPDTGEEICYSEQPDGDWVECMDIMCEVYGESLDLSTQNDQDKIDELESIKELKGSDDTKFMSALDLLEGARDNIITSKSLTNVDDSDEFNLRIELRQLAMDQIVKAREILFWLKNKFK